MAGAQLKKSTGTTLHCDYVLNSDDYG